MQQHLSPTKLWCRAFVFCFFFYRGSLINELLSASGEVSKHVIIKYEVFCMRHGFPWRNAHTHTASQESIQIYMLTLLKSSVGISDSFPSVGGGFTKGPTASCLPLIICSLVGWRWVGDVRQATCWGRAALGGRRSPSGQTRWQLTPHIRCWGCYAQTHTVAQKQTSLQTYKHVWKHTLEARTCTVQEIGIGVAHRAGGKLHAHTRTHRVNVQDRTECPLLQWCILSIIALTHSYYKTKYTIT